MKKRKAIGGLMITAALILGMTACGQEGGQASASGTSGSAEPETSQEADQTGANEKGEEKTEESRDILGTGAETLFGKITAIEGSTITLALAEQSGMPDGRETADNRKPDGTTPEDKQKPDGGVPEDNQKPDRTVPEDNQKPDGGVPEDNRKPDGTVPEDNRKPDGTAPEDNQKPDGTVSEDNQNPDKNLPEGGGQPAMELTLTGETRELTVTEETIITINNISATLSELTVDDVITAFMEEDTLNSITVGYFGEGGRDKGPGAPAGEKPVLEPLNVEAEAS